MKFFKSQITNTKLQTNHNVQNSKSQVFGSLENWNLDIICYLGFGAWDFLNVRVLL
jgi:hypothetical protein